MSYNDCFFIAGLVGGILAIIGHIKHWEINSYL